MEDIKRPKPNRGQVRRTDYQALSQRPVPRPAAPVMAAPHGARTVVRFRLRRPSLARLRRFAGPFKHFWVRVGLITSAAVLVAMEFIIILQPYLVAHTYALGAGAQALLHKTDDALASKLAFDSSKAEFDYNAGYNPIQDGVNRAGGPQITATANQDASKGLTITDPLNELTFSITPKFKTLPGKQQSNRIVYPLADGTGWMVYTMQVGGVKEDIVLSHANGNDMSLQYELKVDSQLEVRHDDDGSIGVYGSDSPLTGSVSTGSAADAALLQKAREHAVKNKLFFSLPAPVAYGANQSATPVVARYTLNGNVLTTEATNLKKATYPITIDPTVTVTGTSDLFRDTNPDSDADFDGTTGNIDRGAVTGGVIPAWTSNTNSMATARFLNGATIYDDYAYVAGGAGSNSTSNISSVEYARLSSSSSCSTSCIGTWATTTSLPASLSRFTLLAYNGYLYAIGGATSTTSCATDSSAIYYNRIQVNGQLSATWNTATTVLPAAVCGGSAYAYNGRLYVAGGRTSATITTGTTNVAVATINPDGSLTSFTTQTALPAARFDFDLRVYNGYIYIVGGNLNGTLTNTVSYMPLASDGTLYGGSWKTASAFGTARSNMGESFSATNDGYMYVQGGCNTYTSDSCTSVRSEVQTAQINADGSLGPWSDVATSVASLSRVGNAIVLWRGSIYSFAGCTAMNAGAVSCATGSTLATQSYSAISTPGQVGPVNTTTNLPTARWAHGSVVNAGYIYVVGGCITASCQTSTNDTTGATSYAPLNADGTIGTWTTDSTHLLNGATGLAAFGMTVYNNVLYATGGYTYAGPSSSVYYISLNSSTGALSSSGWTTQSAKLGATTYYNAAVAYRDFLFVFGGCIGNTNQSGCTTYRNTNYRMPIGAGGAPGTLTTSAATGTFVNLPTGKGLMAPALYNGYIYLAGGATSTVGQTSNVYYARIADNGSITAWSTATGAMVHTLRRADAVAMNGYLYVIGGHDGSGPTTYGDIEIAKINLSTGNLDSNFSNSVIKVTPRWDERAVFSNGYVYVSGGCSLGDPPASCNSSTGVSNVMEYVEIFNAGNKGTSTWANNTNVYSGNVTSGATAVYNGYIYMAGGCTPTNFTVGTSFANTFCGASTNATSYAPINPDGSIGTWTAGTTLVTGDTRVGGCMVASGGYLYYAGGENSSLTATATVFYSQIGSGGAEGTWATATNGLPAARAWMGCGLFAGRIYTTGGEDSTGTESTTVYHSPDLTNGGNITSTWSTDTSFTTARAHHVSVIAAGYLFVIGGDAGGTSGFYDVQSVQLNPSAGGLVGSWQYSRELPQGVSWAGAFAANGYIYLVGGRTAATSCINNTYVASVNSTGRLSSWSQGVNKFTTARFGGAVAFNSGYYYLLGGDDCTNVITSNVIQYGGQQSQAMKALISKYADFNGNGVPLSFVGYLTNAVNNGVDIEKWRLTYKSSMEATNSWGVVTTVYPITSQAKNTVVAYDGTGANVQLARWFWMTLDINMEQSFSFTDDTQPSISQYELYYTPPASKRLMHGRDFRDQTQQDLDAHP